MLGPSMDTSQLSSRLRIGARLRPVAGLLLLLATMLPLQAYRAQVEASWWVDENESVLLASGPVARIFDYTASDTNPPGYFLALKPWLALGRILPGERGVLWARMPSIFAWTLLAVFLWIKGRELFGPVPGAALAWAVCASSYAGWFTDARGFGISSAAVLAGGLLLCGLVRDAAVDPPGRPRGKTAWTWFAYALCAEAALWTHLTSIVALGLLGGIWLAMAWRLRARAPWLLRQGLGVHAAIVLAYFPWLLQIGNQIAARRNEDSWWVTPANLTQWLFVFFRWYPLGDADLPLPAVITLGALTLLVPLAAALAVARRSRPVSTEIRFLGAAAAFSLVLAVTFTSALWAIQRFFGISVFHAPRYPCLTLGFWALGLALLASWAVSRAGWRPVVAWLLLAPWLLAGGLCLTGEIQEMKVSVFEQPNRARMPPAGTTLFVMPPTLLPFTRHVLGAWRVRPAAELPCALAEMEPEGEAWVLDLNFLAMLEDWKETMLLAAIKEGVLARRVQRQRMPVPQYYTLYRLRSIRFGRAQKICVQGGLGLRPAPLPIPPAAAAVALPESQSLGDGWWWPEVGYDLAYRRWWIRPQTRLIFDRPVPAGDYVLHYRGLCPGHKKEPADLRYRIERSSLDLHVLHQAGEVEVDVPFHLDGPDRKPVLLLAHTMEPTNFLGRRDMPVNQVGSTLRYAWLERGRPKGDRRSPLQPPSRSGVGGDLRSPSTSLFRTF